jgi:hypothetical protein
MKHNTASKAADEEVLKHREICFDSLHPDPQQVLTAVDLLIGIDGIQDVSARCKQCISISYDLRKVTLKTIEDALVELGFHLNNSLLARAKRSVHHYTESNQRAHMGQNAEMNVPREAFINRYSMIRHGCRDQLPRYWREYL